MAIVYRLDERGMERFFSLDPVIFKRIVEEFVCVQIMPILF